ncbi:hypothetical protein KW850_29310 [Bacillus sp. sid0103]|uniref:hypothetical protein n=2 Tax=Bacillaceae TaxID=186817 RepID=UPI001C441CCF|nr:hypothetical protein [Bacillus sp. sid0103]MBV7509276.1 hypothetical protein [Bacillus sp. sid0103]
MVNNIRGGIMIKSGDYAIINNFEYEIYDNGDDTFNLVTNDPQSIKEGFSEDNFPNIFFKIINVKDLKNAFNVKTYGKYKNVEINVHKENENQYLVGTSDSSIAKTLGLDRTDKYYYEKWVPKEDVQLFEVRKPLIF